MYIKSHLRTGFVISCIAGIIYGMATENYYGTGWAVVALITTIK